MHKRNKPTFGPPASELHSHGPVFGTIYTSSPTVPEFRVPSGPFPAPRSWEFDLAWTKKSWFKANRTQYAPAHPLTAVKYSFGER